MQVERSTTRLCGLGAAIVLLLSSSAAPAPLQVNVSGTWDAHFSGRVEGAGTSQTDDFVMDIRQNGSSVTGTLRVQGLDLPLPLTGEVLGTTFTYTARGDISPTCEAAVVAETTVNVAAGRLSGSQTQSTCEGKAVGQVTAVRR